ncbi:MAG TPA: hypothetical protein VLJ86_21475 [Ramlibacter sp.]|nr:hypothetical protein [Ramlibacter sp.]
MTEERAPLTPIVGQSFHDRAGQQWRVKERRADSSDQFVIEAQMSGSYPRVALYVMTEREFDAHARAQELKPDRPTASRNR